MGDSHGSLGAEPCPCRTQPTHRHGGHLVHQPRKHPLVSTNSHDVCSVHGMAMARCHTHFPDGRSHRAIHNSDPPTQAHVRVPPFEHTFSFPSGHTLNAVVIAGVMVYLLCQHTRSAGLRTLISGCGIAYALLMGISRVFLAHHWLSDVLAGWCIGSLCLAASIVVERATAYIRQGRLHDRDSSSPPDKYSRNPLRP